VDLLLPVLLLALGVWAFRRVRTSVTLHAERRRRASMPGYSPDLPIILQSTRVLEDAQAAARCECGGRVLQLGETSRLGLRVSRGQCVECGRDVDLYFVLPHLVN
jgi:hypothetical protein